MSKRSICYASTFFPYMICIWQRDLGRAVLEDKYFTTLKLIVPGVLKVITKSIYTAQIHFAPIVVTDLYTYIYMWM